MAKNKIAPPFRVVEMDILFGTGIDTVSCLLDAAEDAGIFTRKGSWYSYDGKNVAQVGTAGLLLWWRVQSTYDVVAAKTKLIWSVRKRLTRERRFLLLYFVGVGRVFWRRFSFDDSIKAFRVL